MQASRTDGARSQELLESLEALVLQRRSLAVSFNDIADSIGISRSLLYVYFDSVPAMLDILFLRHAKDLEGRISPVLQSGSCFRDQAVGCALAYLSYCIEAGPLLQLIVRETPGDSPLGDEARAFFRKLLRIFASATSQGLQINVRESFVILELLAAILEALARLVRDGQIDESTSIATCERLIGAAVDSLAASGKS